VVLDIAPVTYTQEDGSWKAVQTIIHAMNSINLRDLSCRLDVDTALKKKGVEDPALRSFVLTNLKSRPRKNNSTQTNDTLEWKINLPSIVNQLDVIAGFELPSTTSDKLRYHGDTFIISGGASRFIRSGHMEIISSFFPNHMLTTVRGVGHWLHAEAPDDTIALLKRYLDR
jgi:pimeloyl-ACP methyl ester carboxylesterase